MKETDYQIVLIIITIIGFIISTAFYLYFVYLPITRSEDQLDIIAAKGEDLLTLVDQRVEDFEDETVENLSSICESIRVLICTWNTESLLGPPQCDRANKICILDTQAYPTFCNQFAPFPDTCDCANIIVS